MARIKRPKSAEVSQFGGVHDVGTVRDENVTKFHSELSNTDYIRDDATNYDAKSIEVESQTKLEADEGTGGAAIIRCFEFRMNPVTFATIMPTTQDLFNSHHKGIEIALWKDGMTVLPDVNPRVVINRETGTYQIFVGAKPSKGQLLHERPQTLSQLAHGGHTN
jgi:hypothetical protein